MQQYITDKSHFYGVLSLGANVQYTSPDAGGVTSAANRYDLQRQIAAFEPEYLRRLLGVALAAGVYAYLAGSSEVEETERWDALLSLLRGEGGVSPAAAYIFFRILETHAAHVTETGVFMGAGTDTASPLNHQVQAWGLMVEGNHRVREYVRQHFPEYSVPFNPLMFERVNSLGL